MGLGPVAAASTFTPAASKASIKVVRANAAISVMGAICSWGSASVATVPVTVIRPGADPATVIAVGWPAATVRTRRDC